MPENIDSGVATDKATTDAIADDNSQSNKTEPINQGALDKRFAELTGELNRRKAKEERLQKELSELKAQHQTEDEKRIEELAMAKYGSILKAHESLLESMTQERDTLLASVPEEYKSLVVTDESIPVWKQVKQIQNILSIASTVSGKAKAPATTSPANPSTKEKARYTLDQFRGWQGLSSSASTLKQYEEMKEEMLSAYREGRIDGVKP